MEALIASYSLDEIATFVVLLVGALLAACRAWDYLKPKLRETLFNGDKMDEIQQSIQLLLDKSTNRDNQMQIIMESDKCRIRAEIVREYNAHKDDESIDWFSLEYLRKQYECYRAEGGNSFVSKLMEEIESWDTPDVPTD